MVSLLKRVLFLTVSSYSLGIGGAEFFVEGEYLFWQTHLSGLESDFGTASIVYDDSTPSITISQEEDRDPKFKWASGFRVGCGALWDSSQFEFLTNWTHFKNSGTTTSQESDSFVNEGVCRVCFDQVDALLFYSYCFYPFNIKPFIGLRAAQINQGVHAVLVTNITELPSTTGTETRYLNDHQYFKGMGPLLGCMGEWEFGYGWGLYGLADFGLVYGNYQVNFNDVDIYSSPYSKQFIMFNQQHLHRFNCNLDLAIGVFWRLCIANVDKIDLKIGCEYHEYFGQSYLSVNYGNISFFGGTASLSILF